MAVYTTVDDLTLAAFLSAYDLGNVLSFAGIAEGVGARQRAWRAAGCRYGAHKGREAQQQHHCHRRVPACPAAGVA